MSEQEQGITIEQDDGHYMFVAPHPSPDKLYMRDIEGQTWIVTVGTDGQLQTEKSSARHNSSSNSTNQH